MDYLSVFVKYYDNKGDKAVAKDGVDKKLNCIRFKWEYHGENEEGGEQGKAYDLSI